MISHQRKLSMILALTFAVASLAGLSAQAADMLSGTWQRNAAKSSYSPGPAPTSVIQVYAVTEDSIRVVIDAVNAEGKAGHTEYTAKFDGKDYPMKSTLGGAPNPTGADTTAWRRIDDSTYEVTTKKNGQVLTTAKRVISKDGKTRTDTVMGKNAEGNAVNNKVVFDKQ